MTHDGVFTKDNPVLPDQGAELAKEHTTHWDTQKRLECPKWKGMRVLGERRVAAAAKAPMTPRQSTGHDSERPSIQRLQIGCLVRQPVSSTEHGEQLVVLSRTGPN